MAQNFISEDFLLHSKTARQLYHEYARKTPIYDYHCHLPAAEIAEDMIYQNLSQIWLAGDHYKWCAMRANGVSERYCTGDADDYQKFEKWAQTVPYTLRNPLYHWTHLELKRYFGVDQLLNPDTAQMIYNKCSDMLCTPDFSARNLMRKMNVKVCCTTDDPLDSLEHHCKIKKDGFEIKVFPAWRPDKALAAENPAELNAWIDNLAEITNIEIKDYISFLEAIKKRHDFFHETGCRLSDHGMETAYADDYAESEIRSIFQKLRMGKKTDIGSRHKFKSAMMTALAMMDHEKGWVQQLHLGDLRNNNTRCFQALGPDTGFDSMGDLEMAQPLAKFLDRLDQQKKLTKTIIYTAPD